MTSEFERHDLDIPLKGGRNYVRGADIYSAISDIASRRWPEAAGRCRLAFHRLPRRRLVLHAAAVTAAPVFPDASIGDLLIGKGDGLVAGWIEERDEPIADKIAFDEDALMGRFKVDDLQIATTGPRACSAIDLAVVLTKTLHNKVRPASGGKWIFTRLDTERPLLPADTQAMSIAIVKELGSRLTRSEIRAAGRNVGSIYFSVAQT